MQSATPDQISRAITIGLPLVLEIDRLRGEIGGNPTAPVETAGSQQLGKIGEADVLATIREIWPNCVDVSTKPHSGDIMLRCSDGKVIVEVKNYTNPVPAAQVEKFHRDLDTTGASAGVFISLRSAITGITGPILIQYERLGKTVPIVYLTRPSAGDITTACTVCVQLIGAIGYANTLIREREQFYESLLQCADSVEGLSQVRTKFSGTIGNITGQLADIACGISECERQIKRTLGAAQASLTGLERVQIGAQIAIDGRGYSQSVRDALSRVVGAIDARTPSTGGGWVSKGNGYLHSFTGVTLRLLARSAQVTLSRDGMADATLMGLLRDYPKHVTIGDAVTVVVTEETAERICALVG